MRLIAAIMLAAALGAVPTAPAAAQERTESRAYVGPGVLIFGTCVLAGDDIPVGGGCFYLQGDEATVTIAVADDTSPNAGGYYYFLETPEESHDFFCGSTGAVIVPASARTMVVATTADSATFCGAVPTTGTITASFALAPA
jgi:hypothetical protein